MRVMLKRSCGGSRACWDVEADGLLRQKSDQNRSNGVSTHGARCRLPGSVPCALLVLEKHVSTGVNGGGLMISG